MKNILIALVLAACVCGCGPGRHGTLDPAKVGAMNDADWTVNTPPATPAAADVKPEKKS